MRFGIIGSGDVGRALATGLLRHGHQVVVGSRNPDSPELTAWRTETGGATADLATTASSAQIVIVATRFDGARNAIDLAGRESFAGKVVIDVTNPLEFSGDGPPRVSTGVGDSAGEAVQRWLPDARVVKAFNIVNARFMIDPEFPDGPPTMFIAGNDPGRPGPGQAGQQGQQGQPGQSAPASICVHHGNLTAHVRMDRADVLVLPRFGKSG